MRTYKILFGRVKNVGYFHPLPSIVPLVSICGHCSPRSVLHSCFERHDRNFEGEERQKWTSRTLRRLRLSSSELASIYSSFTPISFFARSPMTPIFPFRFWRSSSYSSFTLFLTLWQNTRKIEDYLLASHFSNEHGDYVNACEKHH